MENPLTAKGAILAALIRGKSYGLEIIERVKERTKGAIVLHEGNVYPALKALEKDGLLKSFEGEPIPERGGRPRRYYELTGEGRRVAMEQRQAVSGLFGMQEVLG
jgi:PadR family transcriptional regulator PadR